MNALAANNESHSSPWQAARRSIVTKLAIVVFALLFTTASIMSVAGYLVSRRMVREQIHQRLSAVAKDRHSMIVDFVAQQHERIRLVASRTQLRKLIASHAAENSRSPNNQDLMERILRDARDMTVGFRDIWVADLQGRVIATTAGDDNHHKGTLAEFQYGLKGPHLGKPRLIDGRYYAVVAAPATDGNQTIGVVMALINVQKLAMIMQAENSLGKSGEILVARRDGGRVVYLFPSQNGHTAVAADDVAPIVHAIDGQSNNTVGEYMYDGTRVLAKFQPIELQQNTDDHWGLVAKIDTAEAYRPLRRLSVLLLVLEASLLLVGTITSFWLAGQFTRPVRAMTAIAKRIGAGDLRARVHQFAEDELGVLAATINAMADEIAAAQRTLEQRVEARTVELQHEIRQRQHAQRNLAHQALKFELLHRVIMVAAEAHSLEDALQPSIQAICEMTNWPVGHAYIVPDSDQAELKSSRIWHLADPERFDEFRRGTEQTTFARGDGLPGRVWESGGAVWIVDVNHDPGFRRAKFCTAPPLRGAFAFPVKIDGHTVAILEFFGEDEATPDDDLLNVVRAVGEQLSWVISRQRARAKLEIAVAESQAANRAKSQFLAMMSHEIRTPMNGILGMAELMSHTDLTADQANYLNMMQESAESLLRLLDDILDFSKIEAGKLELEHIRFDLIESIGGTAKMLAERAARKGLPLFCRIGPMVPQFVIGDPGRLRQIVVNLVHNAIKFTDQGEVLLAIDIAAENGGAEEEGGEERAVLHFSVHDTGAGIPADKQQRIFDAFSQADSSTTRRHGGTGLGLAISAQLVHMMGGRIWVESEVGKGTTFHFTIKLSLPPATARSTSHKPALAGKRVLVVDDHPTNRRILQEMLNNWRADATCVASGDAGLKALCEAAAQGTGYDVVILDCNMPDMDGFMVADAIRKNAALRDTAVVMLSSAAMGGHRARCRELGIARYITKPVLPQDLWNALGDATSTNKPTATLPHKTSSRKSQGPALRVLLAEDGIVNQRVASGLLKLMGHTVIVASDGKQAVELWQRHPCDIVLMDVHMPGMDGLEATKMIRKLEAESGRHTPIVAVTAAAMKGDRDRCLKAGMDGYLAKPIDQEMLHKVLHRLVPAAPAQGSEKQTEAKRRFDRPTTEVRDSSGPPDHDVFDLAVALKRLPGGMPAVLDIVPLVINECTEQMRHLHMALAAGDSRAVERAAHTIKGSADVFGAQRVVEAALDVERSARNADFSATRQCLPKLEEQLARLEAALGTLINPLE